MARKNPRRIPLLEWVSAAIGLVITVGLLGFLTVEVVRQDDGVPPLLDALPVAIAVGREGRNHVVEVKVVNESYTTGAAVHIEGTLKRGGSDVETSSATLAYVPGMSERRAGLIFTRDPADYTVEIRVIGYERP